MVCRVFRRVVVETCVDCCAADRAAPTTAELLEYCENLFAMLANASLLILAASRNGPRQEARYVAPWNTERLDRT